MELIGIINKEQYPLNIEQIDDHHFRITVEDRVYDVDVREPDKDLFSILHGDRSFEVRTIKSKKGHVETHFFNDTYEVDIVEPLKLLLDAAAGSNAQGEATLEAEMPGKVLRILVEEGQEVEEEQGLLVLVAMKMENELGSPKKGKVKKILVGEGDSVESGAALIVVE